MKIRLYVFLWMRRTCNTGIWIYLFLVRREESGIYRSVKAQMTSCSSLQPCTRAFTRPWLSTVFCFQTVSTRAWYQIPLEIHPTYIMRTIYKFHSCICTWLFLTRAHSGKLFFTFSFTKPLTLKLPEIEIKSIYDWKNAPFPPPTLFLEKNNFKSL